MPKRKRKQVLVPRAFQIRFLLTSFLYQLIIVGVFVAALFIPPVLRIDDGNMSPEEAWQAGAAFLALHDHVWPALAIACALMLVHALLFSHRIAGPLYRFRNIFKEVGSGNLLVSTRIRQRDLLLQEADSLGEMVQNLRTKLSAMRQHRDDIATHVERLARVLERASSKEAQSELAQVRRELEHLSSALGQFRTSYDASERRRAAGSVEKAAA